MPVLNDAAYLRRGMFFSLFLHALLFLFFADFLALTATKAPDPKGDPAIVVTLQQPQVLASSPAVEPQTALDVATQKPVVRSHNSQMLLPDQQKHESIMPERSAASETNSVASDAASSKGVSEAKDASPPVPAETLNADDVRQYRLNLSREARRYKRYPLLARERGIEGTAVIVVSTHAGVVIPQVSLSASSGAPALDAQALEMIRLAVRDAKIPESLRNRDFGINLPIQFALDD